MDYEKAYKAVLKTATQWIKDGCTDKEKICLECVFPELRESEEERIRKAIVELMTAASGAYLIEATGFKKEQFLSYLEKQKEQIPYIDFVIKPHKGNDNNPYDMSVSKAQEYAFHRGFDIPFNDGEVYVDERHMTQTIGNILRWADEHPKEQKPEEVDESTKRLNDNWMKQHFDDYKEQKPVEWSKQQVVNALTSMLNERITPFHQKSLDGTIGDKEKMFMDALVEMRSFVNSPSFDIGKENSAEWSEEDEKMLSDLRNTLGCLMNAGAITFKTKKKFSNWLKSLRPQPKKELSIEKAIQWLDDTFYFLDNSSGRGRDCEITTHDFDSLEEMYDSFRKAVTVDSQPSWKPSEEQMDSLRDTIVKTKGYSYSMYLPELYEQLKKLGVKEDPEYYQHFDPDC